MSEKIVKKGWTIERLKLAKKDFLFFYRIAGWPLFASLKVAYDYNLAKGKNLGLSTEIPGIGICAKFPRLNATDEVIENPISSKNKSVAKAPKASKSKPKSPGQISDRRTSKSKTS